jgi:hypothetical protein
MHGLLIFFASFCGLKVALLKSLKLLQKQVLDYIRLADIMGFGQ